MTDTLDRNVDFAPLFELAHEVGSGEGRSTTTAALAFSYSISRYLKVRIDVIIEIDTFPGFIKN